MNKRVTILVVTLSLPCIMLWGQQKINLTGEVVDVRDSMSLTYATVSLFRDEALIATAKVEPPSDKYVFTNLNSGNYKLEVEYFYYPKSTQIISLQKDGFVNIYLEAVNVDSLLKNYQPQAMYYIYYFGRPHSSSREKNDVAKKYGVQYFSMGCIPFGNFDKYNGVVNNILEYRNGKGWNDRFKAELKQLNNQH